MLLPGTLSSSGSARAASSTLHAIETSFLPRVRWDVTSTPRKKPNASCANLFPNTDREVSPLSEFYPKYAPRIKKIEGVPVGQSDQPSRSALRAGQTKWLDQSLTDNVGGGGGRRGGARAPRVQRRRELGSGTGPTKIEALDVASLSNVGTVPAGGGLNWPVPSSTAKLLGNRSMPWNVLAEAVTVIRPPSVLPVV